MSETWTGSGMRISEFCSYLISVGGMSYIGPKLPATVAIVSGLRHSKKDALNVLLVIERILHEAHRRPSDSLAATFSRSVPFWFLSMLSIANRACYIGFKTANLKWAFCRFFGAIAYLGRVKR